MTPCRKTGTKAVTKPEPVRGLLFHERWWLSAASGDRFEEVVVRNGDQVVGRLPYVMIKRMGLTTLRMPAFTHVLGPYIPVGDGKPQTQLSRRLSITRDLIDQLPSFHYFKHALPAAAAEGLTFQDRGFQVTLQYTFEIDCRVPLEALWAGMHFKTRQHIRRAEEKYLLRIVEEPDEFIRFYQENLQRRKLSSSMPFGLLQTLVAECQRRSSGQILAASRPDGRYVAMIFVVWGHGVMYYLMATRAGEADDNGSINLLIWHAIQQAHSQSLIFDMDGVSSSGTAQFLRGFGGEIRSRLIVQKSRAVYSSLQYVKQKLLRPSSNASTNFT
jgi:lipid II:glycine glycyltransferase (peptidoglycan interpeptide bridge formation enzyme)